MTVRQRCTLVAIASALTSSLLAFAPSAIALPPGCNYNTDLGVQACLGGGPFDAGKNGNGDTYQPGSASAAQRYLADVRDVGRLTGTDEAILSTGTKICRLRSQGWSYSDLEQAIVEQSGLPAEDAEFLVTSATVWLCSG